MSVVVVIRDHTTDIMRFAVAMYVIGGQRFTVTAPYVARVPAGVAHTFINAGDTPLNLIAVFPSPELDWTPIGPNPLVEKSAE